MASDQAQAWSPADTWRICCGTSLTNGPLPIAGPLPINGRQMMIPTKRPCVLLVEDYRLAREMYRLTLEHSGFAVVEAADGLEALRRVRETLPDLIVMDLSMPVMDGWEATRELKRDRRTAAIPIVALSALTQDGTADAIRRAGWVALVTKPCLPSDLVNEVRHYLSH